MRQETINKLNQYLDELKTIKVKNLEDRGSFITVSKYEFTLNNGHTIKREKILKNKKDGSAVIIFPVTCENEVIMAIEPRNFTEKTVDVGLPAGYIEEGENPLNASKRELLEETGYKADTYILIGSYYQDQGCSGAYNYYYLALNCKKVNAQNLDKDEFIKYLLVDFYELEELLKEKYITGLNSAYLISEAKKYLKK